MTEKTPPPASVIPREARQRVLDRIVQMKNRWESDLRVLLSCAGHTNLQADLCTDCKNMTKIGLPYDMVLEILREEGIVAFEIAEAKPTEKGGTVVHRRYLRPLIGIGLTCFVGFVGWRHGTMLLRLVSRRGGTSGQ